MKKLVYLILCMVSLPLGLMAQQVDDDLYFIPSKKKEVRKETVRQEPKQQKVVVVGNSKPRTRDVDEYNRRSDSKGHSFAQEGETIYIDQREDDGLDGEWVNGFDGSADDYEYATRIIRFRNPRFAVSISSPYYWDIVYGLNSWEWNVYTDGFYAYAFPTFSNRLWWDWRYGSYGWGWGYPSAYYSWGGWYGPSWGFSWGWSSGWWGYPYYHHHHHCYHPHHSYYPSWGGGYYRGYDSYTRRGVAGYRSGYRDSHSTVRNHSRVVGTRQPVTRSSSVRTSASETRRSNYTRPSRTRSNSLYQRGSTSRSQGSVSTGERRRSTRSQSTYNRGSSRSQSSSYQQRNQTRSNDEYRSRSYSPSRSSSSGSYSAPSRSSSSRGSYSSGGGSSRSRR